MTTKGTKLWPQIEPPSTYQPKEQALEFGLFKVEEYSNPPEGVRTYDIESLRRSVPDSDYIHFAKPKWDGKSRLFLYGRTLEGVSVAVIVVGFMFRVTIPWPEEWVNAQVAEAFCETVRKGTRMHKHDMQYQFVRWAQACGYVPSKEDPTQRERRPYLLLHFSRLGQMYDFVKRMNAGPISFQGRSFKVVVYEQQLDIKTQFLTRTGCQSHAAIHFPAGLLKPPDLTYTHAQIEMEYVLPESQRMVPAWPRPGTTPGPFPFVELSYDLECLGKENPENDEDDFFPLASQQEDVCYMIGVAVAVHARAAAAGDRSLCKRIVHRGAFFLGDWICRDRAAIGRVLAAVREREQQRAAREGTEAVLAKFPVADCDFLRVARDELSMFAQFRNYVVFEANPDSITGYNIGAFDGPYLQNRLKGSERWAPGLRAQCQFLYFSRLITRQVKFEEGGLHTAALGDNEQTLCDVPGRMYYDTFMEVKKHNQTCGPQDKLGEFKLDDVAAQWLKLRKVELKIKTLNRWYRTKDAVRILEGIFYCVRDAELPLYIIMQRQMFITNMSLAQVTNTLLDDVYLGGQQIKVINQIVQRAHSSQFEMVLNRRLDSAIHYPFMAKDDVDYEGATVIEPLTGIYDRPIATLDFASLYPSIMMAHNICYSTLPAHPHIDDTDGAASVRQRLAMLPAHMVEVAKPAGREIPLVRKEVSRGILPTILEYLISERKRVKQLMKVEEDPVQRELYDGRQLALKVSANSVYGFTGVKVGKLPEKDIASSVTYFGREMLEQCKAYVLEHFPGAIIVYGDTDSIMVSFKEARECPVQECVAVAIALGNEASRRITQEVFHARGYSQINLEFEKVYCPYFLHKKKKYFGLFWTTPLKPDKLDVKGLDIVRRDQCSFVRNCLRECADIIGREWPQTFACDFKKAFLHMEEHARRLVEDDAIDVKEFVITQALAAQYANPDAQAQVVVNRKREARMPGTGYRVGDRMPIVYCLNASGQHQTKNITECAEDPAFVRKHPAKAKVDRLYYLGRMQSTMDRLFEFCEGVDLAPFWAYVEGRLKEKYAGQTTLSAMWAGTQGSQGPREWKSFAHLFDVDPAKTKKAVRPQQQQSLLGLIQAAPAQPAKPPVPTPPAAKRPRTGQERLERNTKKTVKMQDLSQFFG